jgi:GNAT superfamily N-acetyltransferase
MRGKPAQIGGRGSNMPNNEAETVIRLATVADAAALAGIEESSGEAFRAIPGLEWIAEDDGIALDTARDQIAAGTVWVAARHGVILAFLSAERFGDELHVWQASTLYEVQGQGVGRAMFAHIIAEARGHGLAAVTLTTFRDVRWNAPFYESLGFRIVEHDEAGDRLRAILDAEATRGLPAERRCAMRLAL